MKYYISRALYIDLKKYRHSLPTFMSRTTGNYRLNNIFHFEIEGQQKHQQLHK